jgi:hypothetical protein
MMDESQIKYFLKSHPLTCDYFRGVFARDELPERLEPASIYVVNYSLRREIGTHWILIFITVNSVPLYVDTSGLPAVFPEFTKCLDQFPFYIYSKHPIQGGSSRSCAVYCILLAVYLSRGKTLQEARSVFSADVRGNEDILATFFLKEFAFLRR